MWRETTELRFLSNLVVLPFLLTCSLLCSLSISHTQVYARRDSDRLPLRADLHTHIFLWSLLYVLSFLCLFAGSLALSMVIGVRGYRGLPALRGACFVALMSFTWLPVRAEPEPHRPTRPDNKRKGIRLLI